MCVLRWAGFWNCLQVEELRAMGEPGPEGLGHVQPGHDSSLEVSLASSVCLTSSPEASCSSKPARLHHIS